ncbi:MAG: 30S ribosomal protein S20 [Oribacterium sp.]|nr:30S ribosomal protein S20 [Oribacterium sp.]MBP3802342.1 30S ribosomal protein S20 [Oribacterium sp.]
MANIKSAKKRILVAATRYERNKAIRSEVKTYIKRVYAAVEAGDKAKAQDALKMAQKKIAMAHSKGIYKSNNASRKIAKLYKAVDSMN